MTWFAFHSCMCSKSHIIRLQLVTNFFFHEHWKIWVHPIPKCSTNIYNRYQLFMLIRNETKANCNRQQLISISLFGSFLVKIRMLVENYSQTTPISIAFTFTSPINVLPASLTELKWVDLLQPSQVPHTNTINVTQLVS
jgi:hypothetical protein